MIYMLNKINDFITENYKISPKELKLKYPIAYYTVVYFDFDNQPLSKLRQIIDSMLYNYTATKMYLENENKIHTEFPEVVAIYMLDGMVNICYTDPDNVIKTISFKSLLNKESTFEDFQIEFRKHLNSIYKLN